MGTKGSARGPLRDGSWPADSLTEQALVGYSKANNRSLTNTFYLNATFSCPE